MATKKTKLRVGQSEFSLQRYISEGYDPCHINGRSFFGPTDRFNVVKEIFVLDKGLLYCFDDEDFLARECYLNADEFLLWTKDESARFERMVKDALKEDPLAAVANLDKKRIPADAEVATNYFLWNGDNEGSDGGSLQHDFDTFKFPTISFRCVGRLLFTGRFKQPPKFPVNRLEILDFTVDETRNMTAKESAAKNPKPPDFGFTRMAGYWHRPATVLFRDTDTNLTYLIGQDEGTYFGCELVTSAARNIKEAFTSLIPKTVRGKKDVQRQGEWFCVPVAEKAVPKLTEALVFADTLELPIDDPDANRHTLTGHEIRVGPDGRVFLFEGYLEHEEHETVRMHSGWHTFYRNTAVRSVSVEGVD